MPAAGGFKIDDDNCLGAIRRADPAGGRRPATGGGGSDVCDLLSLESPAPLLDAPLMATPTPVMPAAPPAVEAGSFWVTPPGSGDARRAGGGAAAGTPKVTPPPRRAGPAGGSRGPVLGE